MATDADNARQQDSPEGTDRAQELLIEEWTARLRDGERGAEFDDIARTMLREFCLRQWYGRPHSKAMLNWLAEALSEILENRKPLDALGLMPRPAHRQGDPSLAIDVVMWLVATECRGYTPAEATALAAEVFHRDAKSIERYRRQAVEWKPLAPESRELEMHFKAMKPPRPLPPRKNRK